MPAYSGSVALRGLSAETRVWRDGYGAPHIFAANLDDAARALGYLHASERLFQMEINAASVRDGSPRPSAPTRQRRSLHPHPRPLSPGAKQLRRAVAEAQQRLQAYADGVNAFLDSHRNALPPEFLILGDRPEPWKPADLLVWGKLMALQLSSNYALEALRARPGAKASPPIKRRWFFPAPKPDGPVTTAPAPIPIHAGLDGRATRLGALLRMSHGASNEWVVVRRPHRHRQADPRQRSAPRARRADPLVSRAHRHAGRLGQGRAPFPALPIVLLGQNDHIAWGLTTSDTDAQDLFVETVDPTDPTDT